MAIFWRRPANECDECRWVWIIAIFKQYLASSRVVSGETVRCCKKRVPPDRGKLVTLIALSVCWSQKTDDEAPRTRNLVYDMKPWRYAEGGPENAGLENDGPNRTAGKCSHGRLQSVTEHLQAEAENSSVWTIRTSPGAAVAFLPTNAALECVLSDIIICCNSFYLGDDTDRRNDGTYRSGHVFSPFGGGTPRDPQISKFWPSKNRICRKQ